MAPAWRWGRLAALALLLLATCRPRTPPLAARAILLVTIDTWRADHLDPVLTPNAWALAGDGVRFASAWSPIGLTSPAHATLLTGRPPWEHGMRANNHHGFALDADLPTLPAQLAALGWATAAFVSAWPAGPAGGLDRGFAHFDGPEAGERPGAVAVDAALAWIAGQRGPWFAWVHLYEPHGPYRPDPVGLAAGRRWSGAAGERAAYAGEVALADRLLGRLLAGVADRTGPRAGRPWEGGGPVGGLPDDLFVVLAADHGEVLDEERCGWQHDRSAADRVLHVPLVLRGPGFRGGRTEGRMVTLADVAPTLRSAAGLPARRPTLAEADHPHRLGESGLCEPSCTPGCDPPGLLGRDRLAATADGRRVVDRPGAGILGDPSLLPLLDALPPLRRLPSPPPSAREAVRALGYAE